MTVASFRRQPEHKSRSTRMHFITRYPMCIMTLVSFVTCAWQISMAIDVWCKRWQKESLISKVSSREGSRLKFWPQHAYITVFCGKELYADQVSGIQLVRSISFLPLFQSLRLRGFVVKKTFLSLSIKVFKIQSVKKFVL